MTLPTRIAYRLPRAEDLPAPAVDWRLETSRSLLLVHDVQRHFLRAFDPAAEPLTAVLAHLGTLLAAARAAGVPVVYTAQPAEQSPEQRGLLTDFWGAGLVGDTEAARIADAVAPQDGDVVLTKWRYDAFARTDLAQRMREAGRDQLVVTGVYGHIGCLMTSARAFMQDIQPFAVADAIADFGPTEHRMTLDYVAGRCGVVTTTADVHRTWSSTPAPAEDGDEEEMARLRADLARLLDLPVAEFTPEADLTLLGLDSVRALTLIDEWSVDGVDIDLLDLLDDPTPRGFLRLARPEAAVSAR